MIWLSLCNVLFFTKFKPQNLFPCVQVSIFLLVFVVVVSILKRYGLSDENKKKSRFPFDLTFCILIERDSKKGAEKRRRQKRNFEAKLWVL